LLAHSLMVTSFDKSIILGTQHFSQLKLPIAS
jgi:hypothetical protein